jgi:hypothetical protein
LAIQVTPPTTAAVEVVNRSSVQAISRTARAVEVQTGGDVLIDKSHKVIDFGSGHKMGNVSIGDVGRDIVKVAINTAPAAIMHDLEDAARVIEQLRVDLSKLIDVPDAVREDADDGLRRALEAGTKYNHPRMVDKLESSRKALLSVIESSPAHKLADAIENLLQRL